MNADPGSQQKWGNRNMLTIFLFIAHSLHVLIDFLPFSQRNLRFKFISTAEFALCPRSFPFPSLKANSSGRDPKNSENSLSSIQNRLSGPGGFIWPGAMHNDDPFEVNCLKAATEVLGTVDDVPKQKLARH